MNKSKLTIILFLVFINIIFLNIPAQSETFTPLPELPQKNILTIHQDSIGSLWFGTQNGLIRYDGYNFKTYNHNSQDEDSISGNVVHAIYEDSDGYLWMEPKEDLIVLIGKNNIQTISKWGEESKNN